MNSVDGSFALAMFVVLALPGLVYAGVRRWARGEEPGDREFGASVARGVIFAVALTSIYLVVFGQYLGSVLEFSADSDALRAVDLQLIALLVLALYILLPAAIAFAANYRHLAWVPTHNVGWLKLPRSRHGYTTTPNAWEHAARANQPAWVKVRKSNSIWIGGWVTKGSFISTYPESPSIYIDQQYRMNEQGDFIEQVPRTGIYVTIGEDDVVFWTVPDRAV